MDRLNTTDEISDDNASDFVTNVTTPLEEKLARSRPTTREGIIETLDVAAWGAREISDTPPGSTEAMVIGVIENARDALKAGAGVPHGLEGNDAALMVLVGKFNEAHDKWVATRDEWTAERERIDALPDCPPLSDGHRLLAFLHEHGMTAFSDRSNDLGKHVGALANQIFAMPARTVGGATEKLKIVRLAVGDMGEEDGDIDLNAKQPESEPRWFASVMLDFERLAQPVGADPDDPFPAWQVEWEAAHAAWETGGQTAELDEPIQAVENKIVDTPTRTIAGVVVKLRLLAHLVKDVEPPENLVATVLAGAEHVMRRPGVVMGGEAAAGPDPLVALWAKWHALEWRPVPEGLTDEEAERFNAESADQADEVAAEIVSASPDTLVGLYAQMAVLKYWANNAVPDSCDAALGRLYDRVESALQDAAGQGGAS